MRFETAMHPGMEGKHLFQITIPTNHPQQPQVKYQVRGDFK